MNNSKTMDLKELFTHRPETPGEEMANSISHGAALLGALIGSPILIYEALCMSDLITVISVSIFCASMVLLYLSSTLYHSMPKGPAKKLFLTCDYIGIYLLIAGTYTPFALAVLRGALGWTLFGLIWSAAILGIIAQLVPLLRHRRISLALYLGMGWMIIPTMVPLYEHLHWHGMAWLICGGASYTFGVIFYVARSPYFHFIWHLFTIMGTTCHFLAIFWYALR